MDNDVLVDNLINVIEVLTDNNEHTQAILALAEYLGLPEERNCLVAIEDAHNRHGYLTPELGIRRDAIWKVVDAVAAERLPPNTYMRIMRAF